MRVKCSGVWLALTGFLVASAAGGAPAAAAPASGFAAPICAGGVMRYVVIGPDDAPDEQPHEDRSAACHGPYLPDRKRAISPRTKFNW